MTEAELDGHLYAAGIGSDARGMRVLVVGGYGSKLDERLRLFGASPVSEEGYRENEMPGTMDAAVVFALDSPVEYDRAALLADALKPEARYVVIVEPVAQEPVLTLTNVEVIGDRCVRVTGYRPRLEGE